MSGGQDPATWDYEVESYDNSELKRLKRSVARLAADNIALASEVMRLKDCLKAFSCTEIVSAFITDL